MFDMLKALFRKRRASAADASSSSSQAYDPVFMPIMTSDTSSWDAAPGECSSNSESGSSSSDSSSCDSGSSSSSD
ncbi:hypothetical protein [Chitinimonas naiadis]